MRLTRRDLQRIIEAEIDKMRFPKGPNSRDNGDEDMTEDNLQELRDIDIDVRMPRSRRHRRIRRYNK